MLKYLIYCDFSTLKCNSKQFADFLRGYTDDYEHMTTGLWIVDIDDSTPIYNDLSDIAKDLETKGYADKDSVVFSAKCSALDYRLSGVDESFHVD